MHCNLRPLDAAPVLFRFITTPCQVWSRWTYPLSYYSVLLLIHYFTLWPWLLTLWSWPLTTDLEHLQCVDCDVMKLNPAIRGGVIAISTFDLKNLEHVLRVVFGSGIIFTKFDLRQLICPWIIAFVMLIRYFTLWPWHLTHWPWKFDIHQSSHDQRMYEIWAKSSNPRLNYCTRYVTLWPWPLTSWSWTFRALQVSCGINSVQNLSEMNNQRLSCWRFSTYWPCNCSVRGIFTERFWVRGPNFTIRRSSLRC